MNRAGTRLGQRNVPGLPTARLICERELLSHYCA